MTNRLVALSIALVLSLSISSCGTKEASESSAPSPSATDTTTVEPMTAEASTPSTPAEDVAPTQENTSSNDIPRVLLSTDTEILPEYRPKTTFAENMECEFLINYLSEVDTSSTTYDVRQDKNGQRVIVFAFYNSDGSHAPAYFYENKDGTWSYLGPQLGVTLDGDEFVPMDTATIPITFNTDPTDDVFVEVANMDFRFSSGIGAWGTELTLRSDGSFIGEHYDSDMGDTGDGYPNGTVYSCAFEGNFSYVEEVDHFTYRLRLNVLNADTEGIQHIQDGVRYISSSPYGMEDGKTFYLYRPGHPTADLPGELMDWLRMPNAWNEQTTPRHLPFWVLYNNDAGYAFCSKPIQFY